MGSPIERKKKKRPPPKFLLDDPDADPAAAEAKPADPTLADAKLAEVTEATARTMEALFALVAAGTLEAIIADELSLEQDGEAVARIKDNRAGGKLLLRP